MPCPGMAEVAKPYSLVDTNLHGGIQSQLVEIIRGQQRLEAIVSKFAGVTLPLTPFEISQQTPPNEGQVKISDSSAAACSLKVEFCQAHPAVGDALEKVTPRCSAGLDFQDESPRSIADLAMTASATMLEDDLARRTSTRERQKKRLKKILRHSRQAAEQEEKKKQSAKQKWKDGPLHVLAQTATSEELLDAVMAFVILANSIFIGLSLDHRSQTEWDAWLLIDIVFCLLFIMELTLKTILHGGIRHFTGKDRWSNCFDCGIVVLDCVQMAQSMRAIGDHEKNVRNASIFRIIRLIRMVRLIRIMKLEGMKTFVDMLQGILDGAQTLFWAIIMFVLMVYAGAIVCVICFGNDTTDEKSKTTSPYFENVPRAMLTVFRCSFGDCSTDAGTPLPEFILNENGTEYALGYCVFVFFITIGLFNIISAIFVDSTMSLSAEAKAAHRVRRFNNEERLARNISTLIGELLDAHPGNIRRDNMEKEFDSLVGIEFSRKELDDLVKNNVKAVEALGNLDIEPNDYTRLSDILDPDHSGTIEVIELVEGLRRLRGDPRRSDVISVDLMVRSLQRVTDEILAEVLDIKGHQAEVIEILGEVKKS